MSTPVSASHRCEKCDKSFRQKKDLYKHMRKNHGTKPELRKGEFACDQCSSVFIQKQTLYRHVRKLHGAEPVLEKDKMTCNYCTEKFLGRKEVYQHIKEEHDNDSTLDLYYTSFSEKYQIYRLLFDNSPEYLLDRLQMALYQVHTCINLEVEKGQPFKIYVSLHAKFYENSNPNAIPPPLNFKTEPALYLPLPMYKIF